MGLLQSVHFVPMSRNIEMASKSSTAERAFCHFINNYHPRDWLDHRSTVLYRGGLCCGQAHCSVSRPEKVLQKTESMIFESAPTLMFWCLWQYWKWDILQHVQISFGLCFKRGALKHCACVAWLAKDVWLFAGTRRQHQCFQIFVHVQVCRFCTCTFAGQAQSKRDADFVCVWIVCR